MKRYRLESLCVLACLGLLAPGCDDDGSGPGTDAGPLPDAGSPDSGTVACPTTGAPGQVTLVAVGLPATANPVASLVTTTVAVPLTAGAATPVNPGPYQVFWGRVKVDAAGGELIGKAYYVSDIAWGGCVTAGAPATLRLTYTMEPGSNKVWVNPANGAGEVLAFDEAQLRAGGMQTPTVLRNMGITQARDLAFDARGNLWVLDSGVGGGLLAYPMNTLGVATDQPATTKLTGVDGYVSMAFDTEGNLWVGRNVPNGQDLIVKLPAATLEVSLTTPTTRPVAPTFTISTPELDGPFDLTFDLSGNLWVTSLDKDQILSFSAAQLVAGGAIAPAIVLKGKQSAGPILGDYLDPDSVTFDAAGNLWSTWRNLLVKFTPAQIAASGTIENAFTLAPMPEGGAGVSAGANAFDATGGLWMSRTNIGVPAALVRVPAAGVAAGGAQDTAPDMSSTALGNGVDRIVLNPTPRGLPIRD